jgi:hypothetical protein
MSPANAYSNALSSQPTPLIRALHERGESIRSVVESAIRRYRHCSNDYIALCDLANELNHAAIRNATVRLKRELHERRRELEQLGITILEVQIGDAFNPALHEPLATTPANAPPDASTSVARADSPAFVWIDEQGQRQTLHAAVVLFSFYDIVPLALQEIQDQEEEFRHVYIDDTEVQPTCDCAASEYAVPVVEAAAHKNFSRHAATAE